MKKLLITLTLFLFSFMAIAGTRYKVESNRDGSIILYTYTTDSKGDVISTTITYFSSKEEFLGWKKQAIESLKEAAKQAEEKAEGLDKL